MNIPHDAAEAARTEAERSRQLAEEARDVRDRDREASEATRGERERLRDNAEAARAGSEETRDAAEAVRLAVVESVLATAKTLHDSLEQMKIVEEMRRTLRQIQDVNKLDTQ